jgi:tRNA threonylcarbamoyladenosine biosynthesis protein TsaE
MDFPTHHHTKNAKETQDVGYSFADYVKDHRESQSATIVTLQGELGAGKTTFLQGFAKGLGLEGRLVSPTFIIVREYTLPSDELFYHIDLYRISDTTELPALGLEELLSNKNVIVAIEWPEKLGKEITQSHYQLKFTSISTDEREMTITYHA